MIVARFDAGIDITQPEQAERELQGLEIHDSHEKRCKISKIKKIMKGFGELPSKRGKNIARQSTNSIGQNYYHNAIDYHRRGDLKRAEKEYRKAISSGYKHDDIYLNLGMICKNSARADEAAYLYKNASRFSQKNQMPT